jgi:hypothetical protein
MPNQSSFDQALVHYHANYDNKLWQEIQKSLVSALCGAYQASIPQLLERALALPEIHRILNNLMDAALEICGHPNMLGKQQTLLISILDAGNQEVDFSESIKLMSDFLAKFEAQDKSRSADFKHTAETALFVRSIRLILSKAQESSSMIHNKEGNIANELLSATSNLLLLAERVQLGEGNFGYLNEKLQHVYERLATAEQQMLGKKQG